MKRLYQSLVLDKVDEALKTIAEIERHDSALGVELRQLVKGFSLDRIMTAIETMKSF